MAKLPQDLQRVRAVHRAVQGEVAAQGDQDPRAHLRVLGQGEAACKAVGAALTDKPLAVFLIKMTVSATNRQGWLLSNRSDLLTANL